MKSIIIGAGTYGEVYLYYLQEAGFEIIGFLDDNKELWNTKVQEVPVLGGLELLEELNSSGVKAVFCPLGNNKLRVQFLSKAKALGYLTPNYIHPSVYISPHVSISDEGVYILPNVTIMPSVHIDKYVMISVGANIVHHSVLKEGVFISNGVNLGASLLADKLAYVGMGATVMTGVQFLGKECLIGAGAVVIKNVPDKAIMAGVPAKVIRIKD